MPLGSAAAGANLSINALAEQILKLLPEDGTPVLNRVMLTMLTRQFQQRIDSDLYFKACDVLFAKHKIGRLRGQGGQIALVQPDLSPTASAPLTTEEWAEKKLMQPLGAYIENTFTKGLYLPEHARWIVQDTSTIGPPVGKWSRPDYILLTVTRFKLLPGCQVDLHSFELKTETGGSVPAVHEALAQTRSTHFGHLVWHLPEGSKAEVRLSEISKQCDEHGIGLIRVRQPESASSYEILIDPVRKSTPPAAVEGFLETRLTAELKSKLIQYIQGDGQ